VWLQNPATTLTVAFGSVHNAAHQSARIVSIGPSPLATV